MLLFPELRSLTRIYIQQIHEVWPPKERPQVLEARVQSNRMLEAELLQLPGGLHAHVYIITNSRITARSSIFGGSTINRKSFADPWRQRSKSHTFKTPYISRLLLTRPSLSSLIDQAPGQSIHTHINCH